MKQDEARGAAEIADAVTRLAASLCGLASSDVPDSLRPGVDIDRQSPPQIPSASGLTVGDHQKRQAEWIPETWQVYIPSACLRNSRQLERCLSKLAVKMAAHMTHEMASNTADGPLDALLNPAKMFRQYFRDQLVGSGMAAKSRQFAQDHPDSLSAYLHGYVTSGGTPPRRLWHETGRPSLKVRMREAPTSVKRQAAARAYREGAWEDWQHELTALERAVAGADRERETQRHVGRRVALLSPFAREWLGLAACLGPDGFHAAAGRLAPRDECPARPFDLGFPVKESRKASPPMSRLADELVRFGLAVHDPGVPHQLRWSSEDVRKAVLAGVDVHTLLRFASEQTATNIASAFD